MKKILTIACGLIIVFFSSCNKNLKNSEKFVGTYTGNMISTSTVTITDPISGSTQQNTNEFDNDIKFSITLGSQDDRVIIKVDSDYDYPIDVPDTFNATVTKNTIVFDEVNLSIEVTPGVKIDTKTNASGTLDGNTLNFNATTEGGVGTIATLEIDSRGTANKDIIK
jgi:hypothetical protein